MSVRIRPVRGGDKALANFIEAVKTSPDALKDMSRQMAEESLGLVKDGFRNESDPYGKRWTPKKASDGRKTLSGKTSRLKGGWHVVKSDKGGFTVAPSVGYASYHQTGTGEPKGSLMVARPMVPDRRGIPDAWQRAWEEVVEDVLTAHFSKGGRGFLAGKITGLKRRLNWKSLLRKAAKSIAGE